MKIFAPHKNTDTRRISGLTARFKGHFWKAGPPRAGAVAR
jgi:hypothetical protein